MLWLTRTAHNFLNQALCFSEVPESGSENFEYYNNTYVQLILERIDTLIRLKYTNEGLDDLKVLDNYYNDFDHLDAKRIEYYSKLYQLKFSLLIDTSCTDDKEKISYKEQYQKLETDKDWKEIKKFIFTLEQNYRLKCNALNTTNEGMRCYNHLETTVMCENKYVSLSKISLFLY